MERPRERSVVMTVVAAAASMAVFGLGTACATDQGITGKKLLMKTGKVVLLSKDPSISIAGSDPVGGSDSSVTFNDGSGPVPWSLPKTSWGKNGAGTLFKYKNAAAPSGPSSVKIAKLSSGLLKMVAKGVPFSVPNGAATVNIVFSLDGGTNAYCMTFSGTGDGNKFLVKDATAGTCPGGGAVCGNNIREGSEVCDGSDDTACPGMCTPACTCPTGMCPADDATLCSLPSLASTACNGCCFSAPGCALDCMGGCPGSCADDVRTFCALECCP